MKVCTGCGRLQGAGFHTGFRGVLPCDLRLWPPPVPVASSEPRRAVGSGGKPPCKSIPRLRTGPAFRLEPISSRSALRFRSNSLGEE